ncbi:hypothetical protein L6164_009546 [Bauhinia variegata]|uniref:Uncharacterized protein n=1 Tax=Bauhinia variegata TaxID=167791 RepID=A0ACB9PJE1_BAUVA|nr:hypothetical protein L6164_009546 [Bauhinia variegata]
MESTGKATNIAYVIGDRSTSDVVVRLRTQDGRDDWLYCHSEVLTEKCKYFAQRLSENWPTCQILDSRNCIDVYCQESDFDYHVNVIRLLYVVIDGSVDDLWHGVRNAIGILQVAVELGCSQIVTACVNYLEAAPWEEAEEEDILKIVPRMGIQAEPILARLQPVNPSALTSVFLSAMCFATSSPPPPLNDLKSSAQEQLEYMLTEDDDDAPLLTANDNIKFEVQECVKRLFSRFNNLLIASIRDSTESLTEGGSLQLLLSYLADMSWVCQILCKLEIMREFVENWFDASENIVKVLERDSSRVEIIEIKLRAIEVTSKVLEAIGYGTVILPTAKRLQVVKLWLPFVRVAKPLIDSLMNSDNNLVLKMDGELWQSLESSFVSIILALPSGDQTEVLTEWLANQYIRYPDLTEAFEVWSYRCCKKMTINSRE